jgi:hypothetical protein
MPENMLISLLKEVGGSGRTAIQGQAEGPARVKGNVRDVLYSAPLHLLRKKKSVAVDQGPKPKWETMKKGTPRALG